MENIQLPARERIFRYLRQNRGREVPVSELASSLNLKRSTISNAIKELHLQGFIEIERRPLKRGRYSIVYLIGDLIKEPFVHKNEIVKEKKKPDEKKPDVRLPDIEKATLKEIIILLKSPGFNFDDFLKRIETMFPESISFITDFVTPLMHEVGQQWAQTDLKTAEEHIISNRIEQLIVARMPMNRNGEDRGTIILVPVEGERHVISLLSLEYIFRHLNYKIINLGRALPIRSLIQYIKDLPELPDWIFMSITLSAYFGTIIRNLEYLNRVFKNQIRIAIGGQGISENNRHLFPEADIIAITKDDLLEFIELIK